MSTFIKRYSKWLAPIGSFAAFLLLWQVASLNVSADFLPSPLMVWDELVRLSQTPVGGTSLLGHVGYSLRRVMIAFILAVAFGLPLGLLMGWNRVCDKIVSPIFELLRPIPPIAWIPIAILWLGVAEGSKIFICFVGAFVIMVLNSYTGMRYVDPLLIDAARSFGANPRQQFFNVGLHLRLFCRGQLRHRHCAVGLRLEFGLIDLQQRLHGRDVQAAGSHDHLRAAHWLVVQCDVAHGVGQASRHQAAIG